MQCTCRTIHKPEWLVHGDGDGEDGECLSPPIDINVEVTKHKSKSPSCVAMTDPWDERYIYPHEWLIFDDKCRQNIPYMDPMGYGIS